jgi:hypothetical protein
MQLRFGSLPVAIVAPVEMEKHILRINYPEFPEDFQEF